MSVMRTILLHSFGRPRGVLGKLGGIIMARTNADFGTWTSSLLEVTPNDSALEVGFGPGVIIQRLSELATAGHIDPLREMVEQARARNVAAIRSGRVDLRHGSVESLPFDDNRFDKALASNSMEVWPDAVVGLREMRRVMKPGGRIAIGFTRHSGMPNKGLTDTLNVAGFTKTHVVEASDGFCALAAKP